MPIKAFIANYLSLFGLLFLIADALIANWSINPIFDLLYARIQFNLFYNVHAVSVLAVCLSAFYLAFRMKDSLPIAVFCAFATASIHEIDLFAVDTAVAHVGSGLTLNYIAYLGAFILVAVWIGKPYHHRVLLVQTIGILAFFSISVWFPIGSSVDSRNPFLPSPDFYNPLTNAVEVFSWLVPVSLWFLPRRLFLFHTQSSLLRSDAPPLNDAWPR